MRRLGDDVSPGSQEHVLLANAMVDKGHESIEPAVSEHIGHMRTGVLEMPGSAAAVLGD